MWSWDITCLRGSLKWQFFYLYVLIDIFSRYVVRWLVAGAENAALAQALIEDTCDRHGVARDSLTLTAAARCAPRPPRNCWSIWAWGPRSRDRASPSDNAFSEAHFKTLKYWPQFPERFEYLEQARTFLRRFFAWYNE